MALVVGFDLANISGFTLITSGEDGSGIYWNPLSTVTLTLSGAMWKPTGNNLRIGPAPTITVHPTTQREPRSPAVARPMCSESTGTLPVALDLDGDGLVDIAVTSYGDGAISILQQQ